MDTNFDALTLPQLLEEANELLARAPDLTTAVPFEARTMRYWVKEGLLPRIGTRGTSSRYPRSFAHRLVFIRMLQQRHGLTLDHIREHLANLDEKTVKAVVEGTEPLEVADYSTFDPDEIERRRARGEQVIILTGAAGARESATDYLASVGKRFRSTSAKSPRTPAAPTRWEAAWRGKDIEIRVRVTLSESQRKQVQLTGELLQSLIGKNHETPS
jgi:DNA-binding transcriptional MerR regulator